MMMGHCITPTLTLRKRLLEHGKSQEVCNYGFFIKHTAGVKINTTVYSTYIKLTMIHLKSVDIMVYIRMYISDTMVRCPYARKRTLDKKICNKDNEIVINGYV